MIVDDLRSILDIVAVALPSVGALSLWRAGDQFAIIGDKLDDPNILNQIRRQWRIGTEEPQFLVSPPEGYGLVPARTVEESAAARGDFLHHQDYEAALLMRLPLDFPALQVDLRAKTISVARVLSAEENSKLLQAREACGALDLTIMNSAAGISFEGDGRVVPKQFLSRQLSTDAKRLFEADEDFWLSNRARVFGLPEISDGAISFRSKTEFLPKSFQVDGPRCIVDITGGYNIRTLLPIYRQIILQVPLADDVSGLLHRLRIDQRELFTLAARGRVAFLVPHSPERCSVDFVNALVDAAPTSVMPSRQLAACAIADANERFPLMYAPADANLRREILLEIESLAAAALPNRGARIRMLGKFFQEAWPVQARFAQQYGAAFIGDLGPAMFIQQMSKGTAVEKFDLEIGMITPLVMWGGVFNATLFPLDHNPDPNDNSTYTSVPLAQYCSSIYTGIPLTADVGDWGSFGTVVDNLLGVDNDMSVLDWEQVIGESEIVRLHALVSSMVNRSADVNHLAEIVEGFNKLVRRYESRRDLIRTLNLGGLAPALAFGGAYLAGVTPVNSGIVSAFTWLLLQIGAGIEPKGVAGKILDHIRGLRLDRTSAVMVSRIRRSLPRHKPVKALKPGA